MASRFAALLIVLVCLLGPAAALSTEGFRVVHTVEKGETLAGIARRLKVSLRDLKRWNNIKRAIIRPGQELVWFSLTPQRPMRQVKITIKRGDTLLKLAKRHKMTVPDLRKVNRLRKGQTLRVGRELTVLIPGPENPSRIVGAPQRGHIVNSEQLPEGPGYDMLDKSRVYGDNETITHLMTCIPAVKKKWPKAHDLVIGDISQKSGGHLKPHRSHQTGLDVDIGYYFNVKPAPTRFMNATPKTLDAEKTWFLLKAFLDTGDVDKIFIDYSLQKPLYEMAMKKGAKKKQLDSVFQYPRPKGVHEGIIRHAKSHRHHIHVRFKATGDQS